VISNFSLLSRRADVESTLAGVVLRPLRRTGMPMRERRLLPAGL
jgi:hypothetical protein